jgi:hypothetical protein
MRISGYGITVDLPATWEGRIYKRAEGLPILHAGTFALPADDGDFGSGAVASMGASDAFAALLEYDPTLAYTGIFASDGLPLPIRGIDASPKALQRLIRGRTAVQRFFTQSGRAFCLYVVLPAGPLLAGLVSQANQILRTIAIDPPGGHP